MDINSLFEDINFDNEKQKERLESAVNQELQKILDDPQTTIDTLEKLLLSAFRQIMPFFHTILDFHALEYFADLKNSFDYIVDCRQNNMPRPFPDTKHYITLCEHISYAFDSSYLESCPKELHKQMECFCAGFYKEMKQKDDETQIIADAYNYPIFESYYYFLCYFNKAGRADMNQAAECCKSWIPEILFDILWYMDGDFNHTVSESYLKQAMQNIFLTDRKEGEGDDDEY